MNIEKVKTLDPKGRLVYWIREREAIRLKKEAGRKKPFTDDKILQSYRFCCPRRMDDMVSQYLLLNWYEPNFNHKNMVIAAVLARHFNNPHSLSKFRFPFVYDEAYISRCKKKAEEFKAARETVFRAAYIIRADGKFPNKVDMVFDETVQQFVDDPPDLDTDSMEMCVEELMHYRNIGSFMAGQIAGDLRWGLKGKWTDKDKWAAMGPGSARGMNRLHGRDVKYPLKQEQFLEELQELIRFLKKALPSSIMDRLEALDIQSVLCETDKYNRVLFGEGRPKQKYDGGPA